ncbi:OR4 protein, partial [Pseudoatta argentina]
MMYFYLEEQDLDTKIRLVGPVSHWIMSSLNYSSLLWRGKDIRCCIQHMEKDWCMMRRNVDRGAMLRYAKFGRSMAAFCAVFLHCGVFSYSVVNSLTPIILVVGNETVSVRRFPCPFYSKLLDTSHDPTNEIVLMIQFLSGFIANSITVSACSLAGVFAMHVCGQFAVLYTWLNELTDEEKRTAENKLANIVEHRLRVLNFISRFEKIMNQICMVQLFGCTLNLCLLGYCSIKLNVLMRWLNQLNDRKQQEMVQHRMAIIVEHHLRVLSFVARMEALLNQICFVELLGCTFNLCMLGYYIITGWNTIETKMTIACMMIIYVSMTFNIFIFCYISETVTEQCKQVGEIAYMTNWYCLPHKTARSLVLIISRSSSVIKLTAGKLFHLSIATFGDNWANFDAVKIFSYITAYIIYTFNIFIFYYIGEVLTEQCKNIGEIAYMTNWYKLHHKTALKLTLILMQSSYVIKITAGKIFRLSIATFGDIIKTSTAYLNFLRTMATTTIMVGNETFKTRPMTCPTYSKILDTRFSPINEIMLTIQFVSAFVVSSAIVSVCSLAGVFAMHAYGQLNVLYAWLNELVIDYEEKGNQSVEQKLATIVEHHLRALRLMGMINYWVLLKRSGDIHKLIRHMETDWNLAQRIDEHELMLQYAKFGRSISIICGLIMQGGTILFSLTRALKTTTIIVGNETFTTYPMTCPVYSKIIDTRFSPVNEIALVLQFMSTFVLSSSTVGACSLAAVFAIHACGQLNVLSIWLHELVQNQEKKNHITQKKLALIVEHHLRVLRYFIC